MQEFFIGQNEFRVFLPDVQFIEKSEEAHNSRQIQGIMSTSSLDRQGERVLAKGLDISEFLEHGHFNDNHSQDTSAIVGYPEKAWYEKSIKTGDGKDTEGWVCKGYVLKGTARADGIWDLAKSLSKTPDKRLGFSIEGKVVRRNNKVIEKASIRHVAITNCPVNTEATWNVLAKSFCSEDYAVKSLMAGYGGGGGPAAQSGGSALGGESLDSDDDARDKKSRKKRTLKIVAKALSGFDFDDIVKAVDFTYELRSDFTDEGAAEFVRLFLLKNRR